MESLHTVFNTTRSIKALHQGFREADHEGIDCLSIEAGAAVLRSELPRPLRKQIRMDDVMSQFSFSRHRAIQFDYVAFCHALEDRVPRNPRRQLSPQKKLSNRSFTGDTSDGEANTAEPRIRVDQRLEAQRLVTAGIRKKLLRGIFGSQSAGFLGIQEALEALDTAGEGYVEERTFCDRILASLRSSLSKQETDCLLMNLRVKKGSEASIQLLDYDLLASLYHIDSEDAISTTDEDDGTPHSGTHGGGSLNQVSHLGSEFLAAEKKLQQFLQQQQQITAANQEEQTPRSIFTGAEQFLERAEAIDRPSAGYLSEQAFEEILASCGVAIAPELLRSMLSRFPRSPDGLVNYAAFLQRYGHNPQQTRARRQLKRFLNSLMREHVAKHTPATDWLQRLDCALAHYSSSSAKRHTARDMHQPAAANTMSSRGFLRVLQKKGGLTATQAAETLAHFLPVSSKSSSEILHYRDFIYVLQDVISSQQKPTTISPSSTEASAAAAGCGVGDYLMWHASAQERERFENLMDLLNPFQQELGPAALQPIDDGVLLSLGQQLQVRIQFTLART